MVNSENRILFYIFVTRIRNYYIILILNIGQNLINVNLFCCFDILFVWYIYNCKLLLDYVKFMKGCDCGLEGSGLMVLMVDVFGNYICGLFCVLKFFCGKRFLQQW